MPPKIKIKRNLRNSVAFQEWWKARSKIEPVPADPYRAFMIDRSLNAGRPGKEAWEKQTNRADIVPIDTPPRSRPRPTKVTRRVPRKPRRKPTSAHQKRQRALRKRLQAIGIVMSSKYGVQIPALKLKTGGSFSVPTQLRSRKWGRAPFGGGIVRLPLGQQKTTIEIAFAEGGSFEEAESRYRHEFGHHIDDETLYAKYGKNYARYVEEVDFPGRETPFIRQEKYKGERRAWIYAKEFEGKVPHSVPWSRRFALQTYRRKAKLDIVRGASGKTEHRITFGGRRPGIIIGDLGVIPAIDLSPIKPKKSKRVSITSPDGSYRWEIKPRKPIRIL